MPDRKKTMQGGKRMTKSGSAARHAGEPLDEASGQQNHSLENSQSPHGDHAKASPVFGEAALKEAFAEFGVSPNASGAFGSAPGGSSQTKHHSGGAQGRPPLHRRRLRRCWVRSPG